MPKFKTLDEAKAWIDEESERWFKKKIVFDAEKGLLPAGKSGPGNLVANNIYREHIFDTSGGLDWQLTHATKDPAQLFLMVVEYNPKPVPQLQLNVHTLWVDRQTRAIVEEPQWHKDVVPDRRV